MASKNTLAGWFEGKVNEAGMTLKVSEPVFWHRFPDSFAARGALPVQPGDFMLTTPSDTMLIEVKTSEVHKSLKSCAASIIESQQVGSHLLWHRAGRNSLFLFYSGPTSEMEVWDGYGVAKARADGKVLPNNALISRGQFLEEDLYELFKSYI